MQRDVFHRMLGIQSMGGNGYFTATEGSMGLGDDGSVMMISGLGTQPLYEGNSAPANNAIAASSAALTASSPLQTPVKLFNVELPLWAWLAIAALLGGAGGYYLGRR